MLKPIRARISGLESDCASSQDQFKRRMEEDGSVATSCMPVATRFMVPSSDYPLLSHDPIFHSPTPLDSAAMIDSSEVALMGNLLTDMLSSDLIPYGSGNSSSSCTRYPDILQFPAADHSSKITLLQMLEESDTSSPYTHHLKLPVLEEPPCDHSKLVISSSSSSCPQIVLPPSAAVSAYESPSKTLPVIDAQQTLVVKSEPDSSSNVLQQQQQQGPALLECGGDFAGSMDAPAAPKVYSDQEAEKTVRSTSANSENSSETNNNNNNNTNNNNNNNNTKLSQSSSGTEMPQPNNGSSRPKRKRIKSCKNSEEVESQRQTHIAVERNRRKQMNEHLNVLRSLMPGSYVQRGDQASIIGGAIEFVKELEQLLQCLQAQKRRRLYSEAFSPKPSPTVTSMLQQPPCPFPPPYSPHDPTAAAAAAGAVDSSKFVNDNFYDPVREVMAEAKSEFADIEVKMAGHDAVVKILSQRRPGQLLKTISALESMCMTIVHTNITTIEQTVLYSFTVRIGLESRMAVEEIAEAIQRVFSLIHCNSSSSAS